MGSTFSSTWQRHKAKECYSDCFYCNRDGKWVTKIVGGHNPKTPTRWQRIKKRLFGLKEAA